MSAFYDKTGFFFVKNIFKQKFKQRRFIELEINRMSIKDIHVFFFFKLQFDK